VRTLELDERLQRDQIIAALLAMRLGQNPENIRETIEAFSGTGTAG
jgi:chemotaxis protein MotA